MPGAVEWWAAIAEHLPCISPNHKHFPVVQQRGSVGLSSTRHAASYCEPRSQCGNMNRVRSAGEGGCDHAGWGDGLVAGGVERYREGCGPCPARERGV